MTKILKFNNAIFNLDNLEVIQIDYRSCVGQNSHRYYLYFTTILVEVILTEEEFQYLTEFLKNDFKFHEINKDIRGAIHGIDNTNHHHAF
ncbi:hypothetical protein [Brachyspira pulli]|uniref:hypothetical protein n=1 Tax=Brachyspira pulli TaxID=310721 RepID=UPI0030063BD5